MELYNLDLDLLAYQEDVISSVFENRYNAVTSFAVELEEVNNLSAYVVAAVASKEHLVLVDGERQGVVTGYDMSEGKMRIFGRSLNFLLTFRVLPPFDITVADEVSDLCNSLIKSSRTYNAVVFPAFSDVVKLTFQSVYAFTNTVTMKKTDLTNVSDTIIEVLNKDLAGHKVVADVEAKTYKVIVDKRVKTILILSEVINNITDVQFNSDGAGFANCGYYKRARTTGETTDTFVAVTTTALGLKRKESTLAGEILADATADLAKKTWTTTLKTKTIDLLENIDYTIGDIVVVQTEYGDFEKRIVGVKYVNEYTNTYQEPILED